MRTLVIDLLIAAGFIGAFFAGRLSTGHPGDALLPSAPLEIARPAVAPSAAPDSAVDGRIALTIDVAGSLAGGPLTEAAGIVALELVDRYEASARLVLERIVADGPRSPSSRSISLAL